MNIASVKTGDIVLVNKKGRKFYATVDRKDGRTLEVTPHDRRFTWRSATSREVEQAWHKSRQKSRAKSNQTEETDG